MLDTIKLGSGDRVAVIGGWCDVLASTFSGMGAEVRCLEGGLDTLRRNSEFLRSARLITVLGLERRVASSAIEYVTELGVLNALLITDVPANALSPVHTVVILEGGSRVTLYVYMLRGGS